MIAITTSSSISVKPRPGRRDLLILMGRKIMVRIPSMERMKSVKGRPYQQPRAVSFRTPRRDVTESSLAS